MSIEWDGKGLPPVGCECELVNFYGEDYPEFVGEPGEKVKIIGNGFTNACPVAFYEADGGRGEMLAYAVATCFIPIRTKAERRREESVHAMNAAWRARAGEEDDGKLKSIYEIIYDAITAGKIPGIRLTDDAGD
ncbi:hypothetical protein [Pantoea sp. CCBC3-3-1]|uniref:hypothetical protein n=1 Tax=Pantoea sp. CCBC3-3-1 TaxID=2490851 RepID=UPI0011BF6717|nr:hypothetical protein [Pantoea sp. CCBC3-3-1]